MALTWGFHYLMCPPGHFEVAYEINPWMRVNVAVDPDRVQHQWDTLVRTLRAAGAQVETIDPAPGLPDMVFTANAGVVDGDRFLVGRMRHPERADEPDLFARWFTDRDQPTEPLAPEALQEGSGDALPMNGRLIAGYGQRSNPAGCAELARLVSMPVLPVELVDPRYYHIDLTLCPLDDRRAIVFPDAWSHSTRARVLEGIPEPLVLTPEQAATFCVNSVVVGTRVVMPACPVPVGRQLEQWGFDVAVVDVSEFHKAGGAVRCLTLPLDAKLDAPAASEAA